VLVKWLRRTANRTNEPHPIARRRQALLQYRAAAVRSELLEIAAALEHAHDPDQACAATLRELLATGATTPSTTRTFTSQSAAQRCTTCGRDS